MLFRLAEKNEGVMGRDEEAEFPVGDRTRWRACGDPTTRFVNWWSLDVSLSSWIVTAKFGQIKVEFSSFEQGPSAET